MPESPVCVVRSPPGLPSDSESDWSPAPGRLSENPPPQATVRIPGGPAKFTFSTLGMIDGTKVILAELGKAENCFLAALEITCRLVAQIHASGDPELAKGALGPCLYRIGRIRGGLSDEQLPRWILLHPRYRR